MIAVNVLRSSPCSLNDNYRAMGIYCYEHDD